MLCCSTVPWPWPFLASLRALVVLFGCLLDAGRPKKKWQLRAPSICHSFFALRGLVLGFFWPLFALWWSFLLPGEVCAQAGSGHIVPGSGPRATQASQSAPGGTLGSPEGHLKAPQGRAEAPLRHPFVLFGAVWPKKKWRMRAPSICHFFLLSGASLWGTVFLKHCFVVLPFWKRPSRALLRSVAAARCCSGLPARLLLRSTAAFSRGPAYGLHAHAPRCLGANLFFIFLHVLFGGYVRS